MKRCMGIRRKAAFAAVLLAAALAGCSGRGTEETETTEVRSEAEVSAEAAGEENGSSMGTAEAGNNAGAGGADAAENGSGMGTTEAGNNAGAGGAAGTETAGDGMEPTAGSGSEAAAESEADPFEPVQDTVYAAEDQISLLESPEEGAAKVADFYLGESLDRVGYTDGWCRVLYEGRECYIQSDQVSEEQPEVKTEEEIVWDPEWEYADYSMIHTDSVMIYYAPRRIAKGKVVCVNAGHGTQGGSAVKTLCHPDGTPKVTGGSTAAGATHAAAVSYGTTMLDGTPEPVVTLKVAMILKELLLEKGFDVMMIREDDDVQLDNIARTVMANQNADCHIAIHYDSSENDKGAYYLQTPNVKSYRGMEPVASHWESHHRLGDALIEGLKQNNCKIFGSGTMGMDLTQTSYSTIPSVDIEVGDRGSDYSEASVRAIASGLADGVELFFEGEAEQ